MSAEAASLTQSECAAIEAVVMSPWMATPVIEVVERILAERLHERCTRPAACGRNHHPGPCATVSGICLQSERLAGPAQTTEEADHG